MIVPRKLGSEAAGLAGEACGPTVGQVAVLALRPGASSASWPTTQPCSTAVFSLTRPVYSLMTTSMASIAATSSSLEKDLAARSQSPAI